jgi:hypothetical protein
MKMILSRKNKKIDKFQFFVIIVFGLFSCSSIVAQNSCLDIPLNGISIDTNDKTDDSSLVRASKIGLDSNLNFILWFMGTKENINGGISKEPFYSKKSILTSGREPNHLLIKTLLKKAINNKTC